MEWDGMGVGDAVIIPPVFSFSLGMVFFGVLSHGFGC